MMGVFVNGSAKTRHQALRGLLLAGTVLSAVLPVAGVQAQEQSVVQARQHAFDIPAQMLPDALTLFGRQSGMQVSADAGMVRNVASPGVSGTLSAEQALGRLLAGTGITYRLSGGTAMLEKLPVDGALLLDPVNVEGATARTAEQSAREPVRGYVATRAASGTKSDTPLVETPQSVSVVTRDQMEATKADSLAEALAYTPGVAVMPGSFSRMADNFMVRGFNVADGNSGMLRDGMKLQANVYAGAQEPYGLERVDVVRGAASVLYGQLSPGGVVNAVTKRPTLTPLHEINLETGSYDRKQVSADFSDRLTEDGQFAYRLTMLKRDSDTFIDHFNDDKIYVAPALAWRPDDDTTVTVQASYQQVKTRFSAPLPASGTLYDTSTGARVGRGTFLGNPDFDHYENTTAAIGYDVEHSFNPALKLRHAVRHVESSGDWDYVQITAITGNTVSRRASIRDENSQVWTTDTSLEGKLTTGPVSHTLVGGVDYAWQEYENYRYQPNLAATTLSGASSASVRYTSLGTDRGFLTNGNQIGYYLQDQMKLDDRWVLLVGGRHDRAEAETTAHSTKSKVTSDDSANTGRVGLVYLADNGLAPYGSYSQSFQPVYTASGQGSSSGTPFKPTTGEQVEFGLRYQPPGSKTMLSAAVYRLVQQNVVTPDPSDSSYYVQTGEIRSDGVELEARSELEEGWNVIAAYSYTDARTTKSTTASEIGQQVATVPYNAFSLWSDYRLTALGLRGVTVGGGIKYTGSTRATSLTGTVPGYTVADAMVRYDLGTDAPDLEGWTLALNAKNLFDKEYVYCSTSTACRYGDPLTVVGSLSYRW